MAFVSELIVQTDACAWPPADLVHFILQLRLFKSDIVFQLRALQLIDRGVVTGSGQRGVDGLQVLHPQIHREIDLAAGTNRIAPAHTDIGTG